MLPRRKGRKRERNKLDARLSVKIIARESGRFPVFPNYSKRKKEE